MGTIKRRKWDSAEHLKTDEAMARLLRVFAVFWHTQQFRTHAG